MLCAEEQQLRRLTKLLALGVRGQGSEHQNREEGRQLATPPTVSLLDDKEQILHTCRWLFSEVISEQAQATH